LISQLNGIEYVILFGGYERFITEIFHLIIMILVFYGVKNILNNIDISKPLIENNFTKEPIPAWIWILIVVAIHFAYDFIYVSLVYVVNLITLYAIVTIIVGLLVSYATNRMKPYPLFSKEL
jgi:hypothetical protein